MNRVVSATTLCLALLVAGCATRGSEQPAQENHITIGTGGTTGIYYAAGGAICRVVNADRRQHGVRCGVEATKGSIDNANALREGRIDFGMMRADWQYHALHGSTKAFAKSGPFSALRSVFSLYPEPLTIVVRGDAGVRTVSDLAGKKVDIGRLNSISAEYWYLLWNELGETPDPRLSARIDLTDALHALCKGDIDAMVWVIGHPNRWTWEATNSCNGVVVEATGPAVDKLIDEHPFLRATRVPGGIYPGHPNDTAAFGVGATLVTSTATSPDTVYEVVKAVFENFAAFKKLYPPFRYLQPQEMIHDSLSAPLHDGAARYYREQGWIGQ